MFLMVPHGTFMMCASDTGKQTRDQTKGRTYFQRQRHMYPRA